MMLIIRSISKSNMYFIILTFFSVVRKFLVCMSVALMLIPKATCHKHIRDLFVLRKAQLMIGKPFKVPRHLNCSLLLMAVLRRRHIIGSPTISTE